MTFSQFGSLQEQLGKSVYYAVMGVTLVVDLGACGFLIWGGLQMKKLESWTPSLIACIVALIPCFGCCLVGIPVGIWGLIILNKAEVKEAFKS